MTNARLEPKLPTFSKPTPFLKSPFSVMAIPATHVSRLAAQIAGVWSCNPYHSSSLPGALPLASTPISHYLEHSDCFLSPVLFILLQSIYQSNYSELQITHFLLTSFTPSKASISFCCSSTFLLNGDFCLSGVCIHWVLAILCAPW